MVVVGCQGGLTVQCRSWCRYGSGQGAAELFDKTLDERCEGCRAAAAVTKRAREREHAAVVSLTGVSCVLMLWLAGATMCVQVPKPLAPEELEQLKQEIAAELQVIR